MHELAEHDALVFLGAASEAYQADGVFRKGEDCLGFTFNQKPKARLGFLPPIDVAGKWVLLPKASTAIGKQALAKLDEAKHYIEIAQWALEHSLHAYGYSYYNGQYVFSRATLLADGQCLLIVPSVKFDHNQARFKARDFHSDLPSWILNHAKSESEMAALYPISGKPTDILDRVF